MEFKELLNNVAETLELTPEKVLQPSRHREQVEARYILYLLLDEENETPAAIAKRFGKDRTSVLYGQKQAYYLLKNDRFFKTKFNKCTRKLQQQNP